MSHKIQSPEALKHEQICELGSRIHTALRKCCDSPATTVVYNLIHVLDREWVLWLERIFDAMFVKPGIWVHEEMQDGEPYQGKDGPTTRAARIMRWHNELIYGRFGDLWPDSEERGGVDRTFWSKNRYDDTKPSEELYSVLCGAVALFDEGEWKACLAYVEDAYLKWVVEGEA